MTRKSAEEKWREQADAAKLEAEGLPHGPEREKKIRLARQLETAAEMDKLLMSPGFQSAVGN